MARALAGTKPQGHMPQLDSLRFFAATLVVLQHTLDRNLPYFGRTGIGVYGVWFFFVLSGFLITGILLRETGEDAPPVRETLKSFYGRRFLRIFPAYYLVLAVGMLAGIGVSFRADWPWHLAYLSNWMMAARGKWAGAASPMWSLGVEEQFYLVWPALVLLAPRRRLPLIFTLAVIAGVVSRLVVVLSGVRHGAEATLITPTTSNLDALAIGALLAWAHQRDFPRETAIALTRWALAVGGAILVVVFLWSAHVFAGARLFVSVFETMGAALVSVWIIDRAAVGVSGDTLGGRLLDARPLRYLGSISYGMYLWHDVVHSVVRARLPGAARAFIATPLGGLSYFGFVLAVTIGIASLSWALFEKPINDLKRHIPYPQRRRPPAPVSVVAPA